MSDFAYYQNWQNCPHKPEVRAAPPGGSVRDGRPCWLCQNGCFAMCVLKLKGKPLTRENINGILNGNADVDHGKAGLKPVRQLEKHVIAKVAAKQHYVIVEGGSTNHWTIHDPGNSANCKLKFPDSYFDTSRLYSL
jgi:hypothetical protein